MKTLCIAIAASLLLGPSMTGAGAKDPRLPNGCFEVVVLLDNEAPFQALEKAWGLSLLVRASGAWLLFDTGPSGPKLLHNLRHLGVDPKDIGRVFISHWHRDHFGGLWAFLGENRDVEVHLPHEIPQGARRRIEKTGARVRVHGPGDGSTVGPRMRSTGGLGTNPPEHALVLEGDEALAVVTGCCHPGLGVVLSEAAGAQERPIQLVIGGLHLHKSSRRAIEEQAAALERHGVKKVIGLHCTGKKGLRILKELLGEDRVVARRAGQSVRFCERSTSGT